MFDVAQLNVARLRAPLDAPSMQGFVARLDEINRLAEQAPGFRWRLQDETGNATEIRLDDDPQLLVNMSVWASVEELYAFTYRSEHKTVFARRHEWAERMDGPNTVLWWQPTGTIPSLGDGHRRLALLAASGPCADAFTFKQRFPPPGSAQSAAASQPS